MDEFMSNIQNNGPYIMNAFIMLIGIFASFLSASTKKKIQILGLIFLAIAFNIFTWLVYTKKEILYWTIGVTAIWIVACILLLWSKEIVSRKKIDKMIRKFTANADRYKPICIFGGDLDFFGEVVTDLKTTERFFQRNKCIDSNKQYNQIKTMGFKNVQILSIKPDGDSEKDRKTRIRIGFLKENLKSTLQIKFFEEKECSSCLERDTCLMCEVCQKCPEEIKCKRVENPICDKLNKVCQNRCYNPDTQLRGRIVNNKSDGSISAAIVTTYKAGKSYILKEYSSNTKECTIYQNIWNVWWKKCKIDEELIAQCVDEYKHFVDIEGEGK